MAPQDRTLERARTLSARGVTDAYMRVAVETILGRDRGDLPRSVRDAARALGITHATLYAVLARLETDIHASRPRIGRPVGSHRITTRSEPGPVTMIPISYPHDAGGLVVGRKKQHMTEYAVPGADRSDGMGSMGEKPKGKSKRTPAKFITLAAAVEKYGVAQRVIERLISQDKVETVRDRGEPLHVSLAGLYCTVVVGNSAQAGVGNRTHSAAVRPWCPPPWFPCFVSAILPARIAICTCWEDLWQAGESPLWIFANSSAICGRPPTTVRFTA